MRNVTLKLDRLEQAVAAGAAAIRSITRLTPAGGPGDKVFPPTYVKEGKATTRYAFETRRIDGREARTVLLDSVASQANRMEEALLEGWRAGELSFPLIEVDFSQEAEIADLDKITALQAPHRIADALLRDSLLEGVPFRTSKIGAEFTDARVTHATAVYTSCPTALVFGVWDSTGPKGGLGAKFQRALTSEIVGIDVVEGVKTASRLDPAGIQKHVGEVFKSKADPSDWTVDKDEALKEKGKPVPFSRSGAKDKGTPAAINHGNVAPTIDMEAGGVTIDHAVQTTVLSLPALRRLRFQTNSVGDRFDESERADAERAARTALAALALAAVVYQREQGFDLRSRSVLVPEGPLVFEVLAADGAEPEHVTLDREGAAKLLADASARAAKHGLGWTTEPITLKPAKKLADLIRASRKQAAAAEGDTDEGAAR